MSRWNVYVITVYDHNLCLSLSWISLHHLYIKVKRPKVQTEKLHFFFEMNTIQYVCVCFQQLLSGPMPCEKHKYLYSFSSMTASEAYCNTLGK